MSGRSIAILLPDLRGGGAERLAVTLAHEFVAAGHAVEFVLQRLAGDFLRCLPAGAAVHDLRAPRVRHLPAALLRYFGATRADVLIANLWPLTVVAAAVHRVVRPRTRLVVCEHNALSRQYAGAGALHRRVLSASIRAAFPLTQRRLCVSAGVADDLARLSGLPRDRFDVVHNAAGLGACAEGGGAEAVWGPRPGSRILAVGALKAQKDHALLVRAFARVARERPARLVILGEGDLRTPLLALARAEGVADRMALPGFVPDPAPYYRSADLFVLSSVHEGFGNVIVEAMAAGLPVVATDCPVGPHEILEGGRHGRLVPVGDRDGLAAAMMAALADRTHDAAAVRRRAAEFAPAAVAERYLQLLFPARIGG